MVIIFETKRDALILESNVKRRNFIMICCYSFHCVESAVRASIFSVERFDLSLHAVTHINIRDITSE